MVLTSTSSAHTDKQVQKTNDYSSVSKCSTAAAGYVTDEFMEHFVAKKARRTPLINRGYYVREKSIQTILLDFLAEASRSSINGECSNVPRPMVNIVVLGAGYDTLFFRLHSSQRDTMDQLDLRYIEIDFEDVVRNKLSNIQSKDKMLSLLKGFSEPRISQNPPCVINSSAKGKYLLVGMDLRENADFTALCTELNIDRFVPTFILSEVVLTYLEDNHVLRILSACSETFPSSVSLNYEQIQPNDPFGVIMMKHFTKQGTPLMNVPKYVSADSHQRRFNSTGWTSSVALSVSEFWHRFITVEERKRVDTLEPFDEHEEFVEKCRHYVIALAANGSFSQTFLRKYQSIQNPVKASVSSIATTVMSGYFPLYGHASAVVNLPAPDGTVLRAVIIIGGICATGEPKALTNESPLVHHSIMRSRQVENCLIVVGGRTSPGKPNTSFYALDFGIDALSGKITFSVQKGEKRALLNSESGCIRCQTVDLLEGDVSLAVQSSQREEEGSLMDYFKCDLTRDGVGITQIPLSFNHPARLSSITRWGSIKVLLSGGWQEGAAISAVQVYDGEEWTSLCDLAYPRFGHTSHVVDDRFLVLVGGVSHLTEELPDVAVLDLSSKEQRHFTLDLPPNSQRSDYMLFNHTSNLLTGEDGSSRIWIMGGGGNCFSFGSHFNAHPLTFDVAGVLI